jgi:hypothetical protein
MDFFKSALDLVMTSKNEPRTTSVAARKHKELADMGHKYISAGLDLESKNGDIKKILTLYLDGIDTLKSALDMKFTALDREQVNKLNKDIKSNIGRFEEHVKELDSKTSFPSRSENKTLKQIPPIASSSFTKQKPSTALGRNVLITSNSTSRTLTNNTNKTSVGRPLSSRPVSAARPKSASRKDDQISHTILDQIMVEKPNIV